MDHGGLFCFQRRGPKSFGVSNRFCRKCLWYWRFRVCVASCPNETFFAHPELSDDYKEYLICEYDVDKENKAMKDLVNEGHCADLYLESSPILGRCIPDLFFKRANSSQDDAKNSTSSQKYVKDWNNKTLRDDKNYKLKVELVQNATENLAQFLSLGELGEKVFSDFKTSWKYLIAGIVFSMFISLVWIVMMRWIAMPMIWLSIILVLSLTAYGCYYSTTQYIALKDVAGSDSRFRITLDLKSYLAQRNTWLVFAIVCGVAFAILFLVILFLRKRIRIAIALIRQASRAVASMPSSLFFPIIPYLGMIVFIAFWIAIALYIASSGKASFVFADVSEGSNLKNGTTCNPKKYNATGDGVKCIFQTYGLGDSLFTAQLYNIFGLFWGLFFCIGVGHVALAGTFASYYWTRNKSTDLPTFAVVAAFYRALRACRCCFWMLEKFMKFISKNAYIMIAIYGKNFCSSAKHAFFLLLRNIVRVVVVDKLTEFLLFMGKLVVVALSALLSFYLFSAENKIYKGMPPLNYYLLPPIVISIGAYLIASAFFSVYAMAVDTLFLCFLEDCERNDGTNDRPYFMSKELMKILHKKNKYRELAPPSSSTRF